MKKRVAGLLLALGLLLFAGCGKTDDGSIRGTWGQPIETAYVTFTGTGAFWSESEAMVPRDGWQYLWIELTATNITAEVITLYYDEFDLYIDNEPRFPERVVTELQLPEEQILQPGQEVSGNLVYLVPDGAKKLELVYDEYLQEDIPGERYRVEIPKNGIK